MGRLTSMILVVATLAAQSARGVEGKTAYPEIPRILETDQTIPGGFFSRNEIRGLALPREVLAKIYYRNAMKTYPRVKEQLDKLGYVVE